MNQYVEFERLLYTTNIRSTCSKDTAKERIKLLQEWILTHVPNHLYRFRSNNDRAIKAFQNDEIWGSTLLEFNDPYECVPFYNSELLEKSLENNLSIEHILEQITWLKNGNLPQELTSVFAPGILEKIISSIPEVLDKKALQKDCEILKKQIWSFFLNQFKEISSQFFQGILIAEAQRHIACFSEKNDSSLMWGHYANGHRGFCLEYDFKSILKPCNGGCTDVRECNNFMITPTIAPVIYSKTRFDATSHLFTIMQAEMISKTRIPMGLVYEDTLLISKCLLTKSSDWAYEKEWRLFSPPSISTDPIPSHTVIFSARPTALYIGARSSAEQAQMLSDICRERNIPCYKMIQNYLGDDFKLFSIPYDEYQKNALQIDKESCAFKCEKG